MSIHDINVGPMTGSCLAGDHDNNTDDDHVSTISNPLRPIAPLCIWLMLPLVASSTLLNLNMSTSNESSGSPVSSSSQLLFKTMLSLSRLDTCFTLSLYDALRDVCKIPSPLVDVSEAHLHPYLVWEGLRSLPVIADSYVVLNKNSSLRTAGSSFSSGQVLPYLVGSGMFQENDVLVDLINELTNS
mmetsp:Transcript_11306/g.20946  ORF Transcript_11306/g.20946 Transcript_11306/m.20946 type:complete len:186 (+) Transcript_11306:3-560(+)